MYPFGYGLSYTTFERQLSLVFDHSVTREQLAQWITDSQYKPVGAPVIGTLSKTTSLARAMHSPHVHVCHRRDNPQHGGCRWHRHSHRLSLQPQWAELRPTSGKLRSMAVAALVLTMIMLGGTRLWTGPFASWGCWSHLVADSRQQLTACKRCWQLQSYGRYSAAEGGGSPCCPPHASI